MSKNQIRRESTALTDRRVASTSTEKRADVLTPVSLPRHTSSTADSIDTSGSSVLTTSATARTIREPRTVPPITVFPKSRFLLHESWEGVVEEVFSTYFSAQIVSSLDPERAEYAEIFIDEVSPMDLPLLIEGATFYWSIGYHESRGGQRTRSSILRLRRIPISAEILRSEWADSVRDAWLRSS